MKVRSKGVSVEDAINPDPSKQAVNVYFSRKINPVDTPPVYFDNLAAGSCKYLGLFLDRRLAFDRHIDEIIAQANKSIELITRLY